jgi:DNA-directed RNA polymerase subunit M/transcription elongation factor TFIIS
VRLCLNRERKNIKDEVKENKLKCKQCNEEFRVRDIEFKSNEELTQLIENQSHLSDKEITHKQELEISIKKFFSKRRFNGNIISKAGEDFKNKIKIQDYVCDLYLN